jgi:hypothetical protein
MLAISLPHNFMPLLVTTRPWGDEHQPQGHRQTSGWRPRQTQAAGTPNQAGIGWLPSPGRRQNSVFFADVLANANFADINNYSSIINTTVAGTTISTSSRLGYRWLNGDRSWMYGLNAGYDTRPMSTGPSDTGIPVYASRTAFFQQAAVNAEAQTPAFRRSSRQLLMPMLL